MTYLEALKYILEKALSIKKEEKDDITPLSSWGICHNVHSLVGNLNPSFTGNESILSHSEGYVTCRLMEKAFKSWKYYSGSSAYPVPNSRPLFLTECWKGEQLDYRIDLLKHMIKTYEEDHNETS